MNIYTVYVNRWQENPLESAIVLKEGFSWWGMIFHFFWAAYHRIWWLLLVIALSNTAITLLEVKGWLNPTQITALNTLLAVYIGISGIDWYQAALKRRGYVLTQVIAEESKEAAYRRFLENATAGRNLPQAAVGESA